MQKTSIALLALLIVGCGGGSGGSGTGSGGEVGPVNQFGPIETRGQVNGAPIVRDLGRISTVALAGVLTDATYRPQGISDNETAIAVGRGKEIRYYMEDGEFIGSFRPTNLDDGKIMIQPTFSPDGTKLYFFDIGAIYSVNVADPSTATTVLSATGIGRFALSPDGLKIAYARVPTGESDIEVFVRNVAGGATKRITTNDGSDIPTVWMDNDHLAVLGGGADPADVGTKIYKVSDLTTQNYVPFIGGLAPVARSKSGGLFLNSAASDSESFSLSVSDYEFVPAVSGTSKDYLATEIPAPGVGAISPDGTRWLANGARVFTTELGPETVHFVTPELPVPDQGVDWQPALGVTKFVGSSSKLGSTSAGIIATNRSGAGRRGLASFVSWDAQTRTTSTVNDDAGDSGSGSKTYTIEADRLTALKYANRPLFQGTNTVNASGTANGAIVTIDSEDGLVTSVVIYQETRGSKPTVTKQGGAKTIEGKILGVWDAKGQNLAPQGASKVRISEEGKPTVG